MNIGHCHPKVVAPSRRRLKDSITPASMVSPYEVAIRLAEKLCRVRRGTFAKNHLREQRCEAVENVVRSHATTPSGRR